MRTTIRTAVQGIVFCASLCAALSSTTEARAEPRTHDGFYLQLNAGLGYLSTTASVQGVDVSYSGMTLPSALLLGGTPVKGLVIGGGFFTDYAFSPKAKINGQELPTNAKVSQYLIGIGPFVDFYPNPAEGLHFQGMVGWGGLETSVEGNAGGSDPTGLVLTVGGGYDFWVSNEWSIGVMGRFGYGALSLNSQSYTSIAPAVLATFTFH